ncbi:HAMP domain-containing protein [Chloroflexia bacterium SDU3-3]|nr:HAMP domain-containing protein [Chloroflexia bacterium SDU3-3]
MSIRTKLFLAFTVQIVLLILIAAVIGLQLTSAQTEVAKLNQDAVPSLIQINEISLYIEQYRVAETFHLALTDDAAMDVVERDMAQLESKIDEALKAYQPYAEGDQQEKDALDDLNVWWPRLVHETKENFLPASRENNLEQSIQVYNDSQTYYWSLENMIDRLTKSNREQASAAAASTQESTNIVQRTMLAAILAGILIAAVAGIVLTRSITNNLREVMSAASAVAHGDLDQQLAIRGHDEISQLASSFNTMVTALQIAAEDRKAYQQTLEQRVTERTAELKEAMGELRASSEAREALLETVRALSCPLIPVQEEVLVLPLIGLIDAERTQMLIDSLLHTVEEKRTRAVIVDVTGVPVIDSYVASALLRVTAMLKLLGTRCILVGLRPELAQTIVALGVDLSSLTTQANLQLGLHYVSRILR